METVSQIFALAIFVVMFIVITTGKVPRYIAALAGGTRVLYLRKASLFDHNCPDCVVINEEVRLFAISDTIRPPH